jgi:ribosomal-protein-alanine N-acetyltransferase
MAGLVVCRKDTGAIAGVVNVTHMIGGAFRSALLGYYAFAPSTGQGFMTDGLRMVVRHGFSMLGLHRVEANIQPGNVASIALVRRLGFRNEGTALRFMFIDGAWRDHQRWAMTEEDRLL